MRRHSQMGRYAPFSEPGRFARVVGAPYLLAARLQPSYCNWPQGWMDLVFQRDGEIVLLPFVQIDPTMISVRESSPLIWPSWLPLEEQTLPEIEERVEPWLLSHALLGGIIEERIGYFTESVQARETFAAARASRFLCAAPVDVVLADAAPYVYAQRFAKGRRVGIRSADGGLGASLLAGIAASVHADLGTPARNEHARAWYGLGVYGDLPRAAFDVSIAPAHSADAAASLSLDDNGESARTVGVARPLFASVACSFDLQDGPEIRRFGVRSREPILRANRLVGAPVIGGSEGHILVVIRDNGLTVPDADVDQARDLVNALCVQGFNAKLSVASAARAESFDLIHVFGHRHAHQFGPVLEEAKRLAVPVVSTPLLDDFDHEALWGSSAIRTMLTGVRDDMAQASIERGLIARRLLVGGGHERGTPAYDRSAVSRLLEQARAVIFASTEEETRVRALFTFTGASRVVPCVPASPVATDPIGAISGLDEYVLLHGIIDPRGNQFLAARALAAAGLPAVLVGTVVEVDYYYALLGIGGSQFVCLPEDALTAEQLAAFYAGARVYADLSWAGHGASRAARAAAHGVPPVMSRTLPYAQLWPEAMGGVDPASLESATTALRQAWMRAPAIGHQIAERTAEIADPLRALQTVLGAYAEAAGVRA
ncbi:MAG TPA: hypothetical protein VMB20_08930 [Candidatus Acidoferrum sp.]|nr:hypothetical protein [Candidatus Acidoferrum sp.]